MKVGATWRNANARRLRARVAVVLPLLVALAGPVLVACSTPRISMGEGPRQYVPFDYDQILQRWTRTERVSAINELDDILTITSTFESWDFRWAYVVRYASDYRLTIQQRRVLLESTLADSRVKHQFYVALYGPNRRWNDISKKNSAWIVRLIDDRGDETAPEEIIPITKPGAIERTYFPYTSGFRQAFRVRFPTTLADGRPTIAPDAQWFGLRVAGAQGNQDLVWRITGGTASYPHGSPSPSASSSGVPPTPAAPVSVTVPLPSANPDARPGPAPYASDSAVIPGSPPNSPGLSPAPASSH